MKYIHEIMFHIAYYSELSLYLKTQQNGRIERGLTKNCQATCGAKHKCLYCAPLEPYDEEHLKAEGVKHMSFHSYLRKLG